MDAWALYSLRFNGSSAELTAMADRLVKEAEALESVSKSLCEQAESLRQLAEEKAKKKNHILIHGKISL